MRASQAMVRLVMNLLDVSRSDDGALVPARLGVRSAGAAGRDLLGDGAADRGQGAAADAAGGARRGPLRGDRDLVRRIVENLIDNALQVRPAGTTISVDAPPPPSTTARSRRSSSGCATRGRGSRPPTARSSSRNTGAPAARARTEARSSHGLGLVFCRRAVSVHGGAIWIDDHAARGSCFCVRLPVRGCRSARPRPRTCSSRGGADSPPVSVKLADETPGTRRLYAEYQQEIWEHTDRMFIWLLVAQWLGGSPPRSGPHPPPRAPRFRTCRSPGRRCSWGASAWRCRSTSASGIRARRTRGRRSPSGRGCSPRCSSIFRAAGRRCAPSPTSRWPFWPCTAIRRCCCWPAW